VAVYDRAVPFADIVVATRDALDRVLGDPDARTHAPAARLELVSAAAQLRNLAAATEAASPEQASIPAAAPVVVELDRDVPLSFGAEFAMRPGAESSLADASLAKAETTERADLHALLFRGRVRADIRGRAIDLGECHPFLVAERLVELARRAFDSWERGLPLHARGESAGVLVGVRVDGRGQVALTLGAAAAGTAGATAAARRAVYTFPALGVGDMLEAALSFGRSLVRAILRRDRSQSANLRLSAFRRALREGTEALREASQTDSKVNPTPEPYRAFAAALHEATEARSREASTLPAARLRYATRWRAIVPGIDLRATYLCGDRMIVGAASEMWALDRATGRVLWRVDVARGTSVVTPGGIARLASDGTLAVHDFGNGEVTLRARIAPRVGGPVSGAVVHLPGLPKLVIVTEGEHHLVAVDLTSGEPRWRWSWSATSTKAGHSSSRTPRAPRLKRSGRLLYVTCGDGALTALDVMTGAVVWRVRDRLRFRTPPTVAHDALYVVAGGAHGVARLYCIDAFSGRVRWTTDVTDPSSPCTVEGAPMSSPDRRAAWQWPFETSAREAACPSSRSARRTAPPSPPRPAWWPRAGPPGWPSTTPSSATPRAGSSWPLPPTASCSGATCSAPVRWRRTCRAGSSPCCVRGRSSCRRPTSSWSARATGPSSAPSRRRRPSPICCGWMSGPTSTSPRRAATSSASAPSPVCHSFDPRAGACDALVQCGIGRPASGAGRSRRRRRPTTRSSARSSAGV